MRCVVAVGVLAAVALAPGCTCGARSQPSAGADGGPSAPARALGVYVDSLGSRGAAPARLSAPIAATVVAGGGVLVAGLVVPSKSLVVTHLDSSGATRFTVDALGDVTWSSDATLQLHPSDAGAALVWRGLRGGKIVRQMVVIGKSGEVGAPVDVGAVSCATDDGLAWTERAPSGRTRVVMRPWAGGAAREIAAVGAEREPVLVCAAHRVFALGQGEDDLTVSLGRDAGTRALIGVADFGADEEQEHEEFTVGDELGIVRVGAAGALAFRDVKNEVVGPWRRLVTNIGEDDVVAVDGDARALVIVTTREAPDTCAEGVPSRSVRALRVDRASLAEDSAELAPSECRKELGPFWTGSLGARLVVAWPERVPRESATSAPIAGLAFRAFDGAALGPIARIARPADALVDAGCDGARCYAIALARAPGTTDMVPELAQIIAYP